MYVVVTGSSGKLGRRAVDALLAAGHRVVGIDLDVAAAPGRFIRCDCVDFGEVMGALSGIDITGGVPDAVVHLAGIPMPGMASDHQTFEVNIRATHNVFSACARLGINKVVWASSETVHGMPFAAAPEFAPIDESHPTMPGWSYALAKQLCEAMADSFTRWKPDMNIVSLRFSNVFAADDYALLPAIQAKPSARRMNLWAYVDAEDAGEASRLAVEAILQGHQTAIIAAEDTLMIQSSAALALEFFPDMPMRSPLAGHESFLSSRHANALIGYRPRYSWRTRTAQSV
ncbi:MAG: NAD-dependent epimerase/dehydratase family protein [Sphingomonas sp.]